MALGGEFGGQCFGGLARDIDEADLAFLLREAPHDGLANAGAAAGDEHHLALEIAVNRRHVILLQSPGKDAIAAPLLLLLLRTLVVAVVVLAAVTRVAAPVIVILALVVIVAAAVVVTRAAVVTAVAAISAWRSS